MQNVQSPLDLQTVTELLNQITGVSLVSIKAYTTLGTNEVQNQLVNVGRSYGKAKQDDLNWLISQDYSNCATTFQARNELIRSLQIGFAVGTGETVQICTDIVNEFLKKHKVEISCTEKDVQTFINRSKGQTDSEILNNGLKYNYTKGFYYVFGYQMKDKTVLVSGEQKTDTRGTVTKAKDWLRSFMKSTKYRTFVIDNIYSLSAMGETLTVNEPPTE
jgi:hypothetical protein